VNQHQVIGKALENASSEFGVPLPVLQGLAFVESRWNQVIPQGNSDSQAAYGVMGLRDDDWFGHSLLQASRLIGQTPEQLRQDATANIRGTAALLAVLYKQQYPRASASTQDMALWEPILEKYSGIHDQQLAKSFAFQVFSRVYQGLSGPGFVVEANPLADFTNVTNLTPEGPSTQLTTEASAQHTGYPGATWEGPVPSNNFLTGRNGHSISFIILHTTESTATSAVDWFLNSSSGVSAHYVVSEDGTIYQLVSDTDTAYHSGNLQYNEEAIGIEMEGYADGQSSDFSWQTTAQVAAVEKLVSWLVSQYSVPVDRAHIIGHNQVPDLDASAGGYCSGTEYWGGCDNHHDPGAWWNWNTLMTSLGHSAQYNVVSIDSSCSVYTLPLSSAPYITSVYQGQQFVSYDTLNGYNLIFLAGEEAGQPQLPSPGEYHWDGWVPSSCVIVDNNSQQLEVLGVFPSRLSIRPSASTSQAAIAYTIDGKRHAGTGTTQIGSDGATWYEYSLAWDGSAHTGWSSGNYLTELGNSSTLSVNLAANPASGSAPLTANLTASVSGTASGPTNYSFWWNCSNSGTSVSSVEAACGQLSATCTSTTTGFKCDSQTQTSYSVSNTYSAAGTYTAKVIAERGSALPAESRTTITATQATPTITGFTASTNTVTAGGSVGFTVTLSAATPTATMIYLTSSAQSVLPGGSFTIPAGSSSGQGYLTASSSVTQSTPAVVTASIGGINFAQTRTITVNPATSNLTITGFTASTNTVTAGSSVGFTVTLSAATPTATMIYLTSSAQSVLPGGSFTIPAGSSSGQGYLTASSSVTQSTPAVVTASIGGINFAQTQTITVNPASSSLTITGFTASTNTVTAGGSVGFTVTLSAAAPTATMIYLTSSNSSALPNGSFTIAAGSGSGQGYLTASSSVTQSAQAVITASLGGVNFAQTQTITVNPLTATAGDFVWTNSGVAPDTLCEGTASVELNSVIYVFGMGSSCREGYKFNPAANTWTGLPTIPAREDESGAAVINGKIYIANGALDGGQLLIYDPSANQWTSGTTPPTQQRGPAVASVNGKLYVIGGFDNATASIVQEYDPTTNSWTQKANMPTPRGFAATAVMNGIIYVIGGEANGIISYAVEAYDPAQDAWTTGEGMIDHGRLAMASAIFNNKLYLIGGSTNGPGATAAVQEYNPSLAIPYSGAENQWRDMNSILTARRFAVAATVNGTIYVIGGIDGNGNPLTSIETGTYIQATATPTVTVTPSASSITTAQTLSVQVIVSGVAGSSTPTGSVILSGGGYTSAAATLSSGGATINIPTKSLAAGTDTLTVTYTPDSASSSTYNSATGSNSVTVTTPAKTTPTVTVTPSASSITTAQTLTVTVTVNGGSGNPTPTGTVTLSGGGYTSSATTLSSGSATINVPAGSLATGNDTLTVSYTPDSNSSSIYNSAAGSNSVTVTTPVKTTPTVTVTPSASSITTAQVLSVMVAVSGGSGNLTPTGSVTLTGGGYTSSAAILSNGSATINIPAGSLATGNDTLTVSYTPDSSSSSTYNNATGSSSVTVTNPAKTTPTVTATPSASSITTAQALTITVAVNGGSGNPTPTGSVTLTSGSYTSAAATLSSGGATINVPAGSLAKGSDTLTANYTPDTASSSIYNAATGTSLAVTVTQAKTTPTVTVTPSVSSITTAQSLTVTVAINGGSGNPTPTGSATVTSGSYTSGAATLSSGGATITVPAGSLATGSDTLTVTYTPDSSSSSTYNSATGSNSVTVTAAPKTTPTVTVTPSASSITTAQPLTVTVSISGGSGNPTPTGSVILSGGGYTSAAATLSSGGATINIPTKSLAAGTDTLTVTYTPDSASSSTYNSATGSNSVTVTTPAKTTPTVTVTPSASSITTAQTLTVTVTVNGGSGNPTPTGTVTLSGGGYTSSATTLSSGSATINIPAGSLATGNDTLTVGYTPDSSSSSTYNSATGSNSVTVTTPVKTTPTVTVTPSASSITTAQVLSVTVAVSGGSGNLTPTGSVTLTGGGYTSSAAILSNGSATINIPAGSLTTGADTLTASYTPDSSSSSTYNTAAGSNSVTVPTTVSSSFTVSGTAVSVAPGATIGNTSTISVTPNGGFTGSVTLTAAVTSSPSGAQYPPTLSFGSTSPVSITGVNPGTATLTISTTAAISAALVHPKRPGGSWYAAGGATLACLLLFGIPARRRSWRTMLGMFALLVAIGGGLLACGGGSSNSGGGGTSNPGTTAGTYIVTVTGTSGTTTATVTITVTVQ
jgi:N-acetyl-anhydromuramyl-L-alanine amidase AmpD/N-acetylneuraminic acid mutarotase